ncbi:MAG: hypothetical protein GEU81_17450 [Nitriliruptorales bacterium]|nr:hypothetical protein [Nitriliruptorales bacterium]
MILIGGAFNDRSTVAGLAVTLVLHATAVTYYRRRRGGSGDGETYAVERGVLNQPEALRPTLVDFLR